MSAFLFIALRCVYIGWTLLEDFLPFWLNNLPKRFVAVNTCINGLRASIGRLYINTFWRSWRTWGLGPWGITAGAAWAALDGPAWSKIGDKSKVPEVGPAVWSGGLLPLLEGMSGTISEMPAWCPISAVLLNRLTELAPPFASLLPSSPVFSLLLPRTEKWG